nr:MAG TPA: hypothetical protein [Bacteriophage sp.]
MHCSVFSRSLFCVISKILVYSLFFSYGVRR